MRKATMVTVALLIAAVAVPQVAATASPHNPNASAAHGASGKRDKSPAAQTATKQVPTTCAGARRAVRFLAIRYKKIRKRARFDSSLYGKVNRAYRDYKQAIRIKNRICSAVTPPPPLALTASEVGNRVFQQAYQYCLVDAYCYEYGSYSTNTCASKSTYTWVCYGYNLETYGDTCDFREVVSRVGYNGITSQRDASYGSGGWSCY